MTDSTGDTSRLAALAKRKENLSEKEIREVVEILFSLPNAEDPDGILKQLILALKGDEKTLRILVETCGQYVRRLPTPLPPFENRLDIVGTGGVPMSLFNFSTASAIVVAAKFPVVKSGNSRSTSMSGASDILTALGIEIPEVDSKEGENMTKKENDNLSKKEGGRIISSLSHANIAYCHAPSQAPFLAPLKKLRREIGKPTVFNLLGPLINWGNVSHKLVGVNCNELVPIFAKILRDDLSLQRFMVFSSDGKDELVTSGPADVAEKKKNGELEFYTIDPKNFGFSHSHVDSLRGGTPEENAARLYSLLRHGLEDAVKDTILLNAAAGLYLTGQTGTIADGVKEARAIVDDGAAFQVLQKWRTHQKSLKTK